MPAPTSVGWTALMMGAKSCPSSPSVVPSAPFSWEMPPLLRTQAPELGPFWQRSTESHTVGRCLPIPPASQELRIQRCLTTTDPTKFPWKLLTATSKPQAFVAFKKHRRDLTGNPNLQSLAQSLTVLPETSWFRSGTVNIIICLDLEDFPPADQLF